MTYTIITTPHPLDDIWELAALAVEKAEADINALGDDYEDEQLDAAVEVLNRAVLAICALPARNLADTLYKCSVSGIWNGKCLNDVSASAIFNEADDLLDAALGRGREMQAEAT